MARSLKKGPFVDEHVMKKVVAAKKANDNKPIKTKAQCKRKSASKGTR